MSNGPANSRNFVFFVDALKYSFEASRRYFESINRSLEEIERAFGTSVPEAKIFPVVADAWSLIDTGHRIRELIQQAPGLKKNSTEVQLFIRGTEKVEELRHYVQHLRTGISALPEKSTPLWGVLSWVSHSNKDESYTIISGTPMPDVNVYSCAYDTWNRTFAQKLVLGVNDINVELEDLSARIASLNAYVKNWAEQKGYKYESRDTPLFKFSVAGRIP